MIRRLGGSVFFVERVNIHLDFPLVNLAERGDEMRNLPNRLALDPRHFLMKLSDLITGLRDQLELDALEPDEDGVYGIVFDEGLDIEIVSLTTNIILLRSYLVEVPSNEHERDAFYQGFLKHNLAALRDQWASLSLDSEASCLWLASRHRLDQIDLRTFIERFEGFVNTVAWWYKYRAFTLGVSKKDYLVDQGIVDGLPMNFIRP